MRPLLKGLLSAVLAVTLVVPALTHAAPYIFLKIADTSTPIPGGSGTFTHFDGYPALDGRAVAFVGYGAGEQAGVYTTVGGTLHVVADTNTPIPGGTTNFTSTFSPVSLDKGNVAFVGFGPQSAEGGVYTDIGGLHAVADMNTPIPGGTGTFNGFSRLVYLDRGYVAFHGFRFGAQGIYTDRGGLHAIVDNSTPTPDGMGTFISFGGFAWNNGNLALLASGSEFQPGIYSDVRGLHLIASANTPIPGGTSTFTSFNVPALDNRDVAFYATGLGQDGIYSDIGGLHVIADRNTPIPSGTGTFTSFAPTPSIDNKRVAFVGFSSTGQPEGIYLATHGKLETVVNVKTLLDGKQPDFFSIRAESLDGRNVAFWARFTDGSQGIFIATLGQAPNF